MLHKIPHASAIFIRSMGKLLRVSHIADSDDAVEQIKKINPDFVLVGSSADTGRGNTLHYIANAYDPDNTPTLAKAIPETVIRCVDELDTFVHCLLIDGQLDDQRRSQLCNIVPLVQDARTLCIPTRGGASEVAHVRYSYMDEQCQGIMDLVRKLAAMHPTASAGQIAEVILEAQALDRQFPADKN